MLLSYVPSAALPFPQRQRAARSAERSSGHGIGWHQQHWGHLSLSRRTDRACLVAAALPAAQAAALLAAGASSKLVAVGLLVATLVRTGVLPRETAGVLSKVRGLSNRCHTCRHRSQPGQRRSR